MLDVLFTHSYFARFDSKEWKAHMPYPPLGTVTAAAFLRRDGYSVGLHDVMLAHDEAEIVPVLERLGPRMVVLYDDSFNYLTKMCLSRMRQAAFRLVRYARMSGCIVAVFSSDSADHVDEYLANGAQYVLCGEAELTLAELCDTLLRSGSRNLRNIPGLAFLDATGSVQRTGRRSPMKDLDSLPIPAWDLVDLHRYRSIWRRHHGYFSLNISTTRGCPFHCNWCAKPLYGQVYNSRSPRHVVEEMRFLKETYNPDHLWVTDDIFALKPGWIREFDELVNREGAKIPFKCLSRVDLLLKDETVSHLRRAGCQTVWVGAESGSQKILDAMEKGTTVEEIVAATRLLRQHGIRVGFFLQFGYPGETRADIERTLAMVRDCQPDEIGISVSYPLPGTRFYEAVRARMGEKQNWVDSKDLDLMFPGEYPPDFYRILHTIVHKRFRIWRGLRRMSGEGDHSALRSLGSMLYSAVTLPFEERKLARFTHQEQPYGS
jgi:anaerobic magnesium-protoporphyrin IX monomethyl ester cyclase